MMLLTINTNLLLENTPYKYLGLNGYGIIFRLVLYLIQFITTLSFFSIISNKEKRYTYIGENTLCIYILHAFIVKFIVSMGYYKHYTIVKLIAIIILSMVTVYFLGNLEINKLKIYRKH